MTSTDFFVAAYGEIGLSVAESSSRKGIRVELPYTDEDDVITEFSTRYLRLTSRRVKVPFTFAAE